MADNAVTQVLNKGPNVKANPKYSKLFDQGKLYHLRLGLDKKVYYGTKSELDTIFKNRATSGGARILDIEPPKGYVTGEDMFKAARDKKIFVSQGRQASNFADKFGFPKKTVKGKMFFDISKLEISEEVDKIQKAQVASGSGTPEAKAKFFKGKSFESKKRNKALKKFGGVKEGPFQGTKKTNLSHMDDIFSQYIKGSNIGYAPSSINYKLGDKGGIDLKMRALYKKRDRLLNENPKDLVKQLEDINIKGAKLAGQSQGFKQFTFMDPITKETSSFGGGRLTVDMFDEFPGMTERQIVDYIKNSDPNDFDAQLKIRLFEENRKNVFKAANKISKKEQLAVCSLLSRGGLPGDCAAAINNDPVKAAQIFEQADSSSSAMTKLKQASSKFLQSPLTRGAGRFGALAAVGAAGAGAVKTFMNDDPTTYLSNEEQQKNMLIDMVTGSLDDTPQKSPAILDYQLPALGATAVAGTAAVAPSTIEAARSGALGSTKSGITKTALKTLGRGLATLGTPAGLLATEPLFLAGQIQQGDSLGEIATNPMNYLGAAFAGPVTEFATKGLNPTIAKTMRLGISPSVLKTVSRRFGLPGLALSAGISGYEMFDDYRNKRGMFSNEE
jgi:hypothetical protein